jgi:hypothetical protein
VHSYSKTLVTILLPNVRFSRTRSRISTIERPATASGQLRVIMRTRRFAASIRFCNRFANRAQRSGVVPFRFAVITLDTELPPQAI